MLAILKYDVTALLPPQLTTHIHVYIYMWLCVTGSPVVAVPPRIASPSSHTAGSDMLRSMLTGDIAASSGSSRPRSNSGTGSSVSSNNPAHVSRGARRNTGSRSVSPGTNLSSGSPLLPISPANSMELQVRDHIYLQALALIRV